MIRANQKTLNDHKTERSAAVAKALGHPARIEIVKFMMGRKFCFCDDITNILPLAQSTISQHLKVLKDADLITGTVDGVRTCYCLNPNGFNELNNLLSDLTSKLAKTCC